VSWLDILWSTLKQDLSNVNLLLTWITWSFLQCSVMLMRYMLSSCGRLSVCHKLVFYQDS